MEIQLENLTAHPVRVVRERSVVAQWPVSGRIARLREVTGEPTDLPTTAGSVPVVRLRYAAEVEGLPDPQPGHGFIVSRVLAAAVARQDLYFPHPEIRDGSGAVVAAGGLARFDHDSITQPRR